ncbi:hypothetical protein [Marinobacter salicampi]|uniref:hypothetical protein n=1 Tax=Marinobacter salicampi TaxID=435907 RepID=UPI00140A28CD|nr:hypothetical protein [Marinobacter salicampi]
MGKRVPEPAMKLSVPPYEISDHTAAIKARRLMAKLTDYATADNWGRKNVAMGLNNESSPTRRWKTILNMPKLRNDLLGGWFDRHGRPMPKPDPKTTAKVMVWMLASTKKRIGYMDGDNVFGVVEGEDSVLFLAGFIFSRNEIRRPDEMGRQVGTAVVMLQVTFHAIQRMIQRGYALTEDGELGYIDLLNCLAYVYSNAKASYEADKSLPATYRVEHEGAVFIVQAKMGRNNEEDMTLVTMLPPKK